MPRLPRDNNPAELQAFDAVCQRLGGFDSRIDTEWVDGYMTALAAGPRPVPTEEWLAAMCDDAFDRAFADPADREQALRALRTRQSVLADQLDAEQLIDAPDRLRLSPLMTAWDEAAQEAAAETEVLLTGSYWTLGFFEAVKDFAADWRAPAEDEAELFADLMAQVQALEHEAGSAELQAHIDAVYEGKPPDRDRLVDEACYAIQDLRVWWVDHAPVPETRRVEKTPGRNDPCHCGSGKKFKKCHGA